MELDLTEEFLLLALDDDKGEFIPESTALLNGFAATLILELICHRRVIVENDKVVVRDKANTEYSLLNQALEAMASEPSPKSPQDWLKIFYSNAQNIQKRTLEELIQKGILREEKGRIFWVFGYKRYPTENPVPENLVRTTISEIVLGNKQPSNRELVLLALIDACKLTKEAFREPDAYEVAATKTETLMANYHQITEIDSEVFDSEKRVLDATRRAIATPTAIH